MTEHDLKIDLARERWARRAVDEALVSIAAERDRYLAALQLIVRESPDSETWSRSTAREALDAATG